MHASPKPAAGRSCVPGSTTQGEQASALRAGRGCRHACRGGAYCKGLALCHSWEGERQLSGTCDEGADGAQHRDGRADLLQRRSRLVDAQPAQRRHYELRTRIRVAIMHGMARQAQHALVRSCTQPRPCRPSAAMSAAACMHAVEGSQNAIIAAMLARRRSARAPPPLLCRLRSSQRRPPSRARRIAAACTKKRNTSAICRHPWQDEEARRERADGLSPGKSCPTGCWPPCPPSSWAGARICRAHRC